MKIINLHGVILFALLLISCGGGSSSVTPPTLVSSNTTNSMPVTSTNVASTPAATQVSLSGKVTFDQHGVLWLLF